MSSLLPRHRGSSPDTHIPVFSNLKRKTIPEEDEITEPPRKIAAVDGFKPSRPLQASRTATNLGSSSSSRSTHLPKALTKPSAPRLGTSSRSTARGTSAPPTSSNVIPRTVSRPGLSRKDPSSSRTVSGPVRAAANGDDHRFDAIQVQLSSLETARAADAARLAKEMEAEKTKVAELQANHFALSRELAAAKDQELTQRRELNTASDEIVNLKKMHSMEILDLEMSLKKRDRELREANEDLRIARDDLERERQTVSTLKSTISQQANSHLTLTTEVNSLKAQNNALQAHLDASSRSISDVRFSMEAAEKRIAELKEEVMESEMIRRKLHNMVQELKGNIRVFCRVRPVLPSDAPSSSVAELTPGTEAFDTFKEESRANIDFPDPRDHKEIVLSSSSESATGQERKETYNFSFDRVFDPTTTQAQVFEEISQLTQSCADGYNVCLFAYGQTGSGKSFTMEGGTSEATTGMIPRAVDHIFLVAEQMKSKGWEYTIEGQFLEIYNETINDLLGKHEFDKKKHEIKHDAKTGATRVTDLTVIPLHSPGQVRTLLASAQSRRSVAATLMNERSSRSHSVFTLRINGTNKSTKETCEGSLNLVDLAGSERINVSFGSGFGSASGSASGDKERLKETQSINKSLSALGDVIAALGEKGEKGEKHIPYRNSKLTYLLQNSLSGNSKTLMFLNLSPLAAHVNESLTSLRFATKVNNTTIGTAKKQMRAS
ncbi:kinesin-domain-containing protein [Mycena floridula]|nr:kinesin-domain-containing protein [Mycena floridula]